VAIEIAEQYKGCDAVSLVPYSRWDLDVPSWYGNKQLPARFGVFLNNVDLFDAEVFSITTPEAELMDPQQRILLEVRILKPKKAIANMTTHPFSIERDWKCHCCAKSLPTVRADTVLFRYFKILV
jgi:hypothetical protein